MSGKESTIAALQTEKERLLARLKVIDASIEKLKDESRKRGAETETEEEDREKGKGGEENESAKESDGITTEEKKRKTEVDETPLDVSTNGCQAQHTSFKNPNTFLDDLYDSILFDVETTNKVDKMLDDFHKCKLDKCKLQRDLKELFKGDATVINGIDMFLNSEPAMSRARKDFFKIFNISSQVKDAFAGSNEENEEFREILKRNKELCSELRILDKQIDEIFEKKGPLKVKVTRLFREIRLSITPQTSKKN